ncbi:BrnA antitoxin family protein [Methylobacterium sp. J-078]|uniref:BrnA antitoxin family protein n=1 Tax=Methylobacterium sp. J-078 TaxID=2836657 RepID=UPI001FB9C531|nr:BrnA antitoxin family protein [Methylobacterium sp. J-078]MCJ2047942.1 BrnA antitoxin family protein [Methylobacterium sp. J-078]
MTDTAPEKDPRASGYSQADWDDVSDNPELSEAEIAELRPARDLPEIYDLLPKRGRGRPKSPDAKVNLTLRIEPALLEAYKARGSGWQVRMQEALASFLRADTGSLTGGGRSKGTGRKRANHASPKSD